VRLALPDVLGTKIGCLVAVEFADPHRLATLGVTRFVRFAAHRGLRVRRSAVERLMTTARDALPRRLWWPAGSWSMILGCWTSWTFRSPPRKPRWPAAARYTVRAVDQRARLGGGPCRQLRSRGRRPGSVARCQPAVSRPVCPRPNTSRPGGVVTTPSAGKAAWLCGGL
jgi:hypothetical protein